MKLSSISLIAVALAAIMGSAAAAPALRPVERNLFERGVNIYSRASNELEQHQKDHKKVADEAFQAIMLCRQVTNLARQRDNPVLAGCFNRASIPELADLRAKHWNQSLQKVKNDTLHNSISKDLRTIEGTRRRAEEALGGGSSLCSYSSSKKGN